jgi:hypothetical protein
MSTSKSLERSGAVGRYFLRHFRIREFYRQYRRFRRAENHGVFPYWQISSTNSNSKSFIPYFSRILLFLEIILVLNNNNKSPVSLYDFESHARPENQGRESGAERS